MSKKHNSVSDMTATVKSREVQRALLAEMAKDREAAARHFLAAAHLELVLASDYEEAGEDNLALRCKLSAASCFWRASHVQEGQALFKSLLRSYPSKSKAIRQTMVE